MVVLKVFVVVLNASREFCGGFVGFERILEGVSYP